MKEVIEVEVSDLKLDLKYFSFKFKIVRNGKTFKEDTYSDDHVWGDKLDEFKSLLENGYAVELALSNI